MGKGHPDTNSMTEDVTEAITETQQCCLKEMSYCLINLLTVAYSVKVQGIINSLENQSLQTNKTKVSPFKVKARSERFLCRFQWCQVLR